MRKKMENAFLKKFMKSSELVKTNKNVKFFENDTFYKF